MFKILWIAAGVGFTVWCVMTHQPMWGIILNVVMDVYLILSFLAKDR